MQITLVESGKVTTHRSDKVLFSLLLLALLFKFDVYSAQLCCDILLFWVTLSGFLCISSFAFSLKAFHLMGSPSDRSLSNSWFLTPGKSPYC